MAKLITERPGLLYACFAIVAFVVVIGGCLTIVRPETLTFHDYLQDLALIGAGLGVGSGVTYAGTRDNVDKSDSP